MFDWLALEYRSSYLNSARGIVIMEVDVLTAKSVHTRANGTICRQYWMLRPNNNPLWLNWNSYLPDIIAISPPHQCHCNSRAQSKLLRWSAVSQSIMIISISVLSLFLRKYPTILFKTRASSEFSDSKLVMSRGVEETRYISIKYIFHICLVFLVC